MTSVRRAVSINKKIYITGRKSLRKKNSEVSDLLLHTQFNSLRLFDNEEFKLKDYFPNKIAPISIKLLREAFINQKRMIRNASELNFNSLTYLIPAHYKHVNNEIKYICQMVDSMQEIEFTNIFMGHHLQSFYPISQDARQSIVEWLSKFLSGFNCKHSTFELAVAIFDQYLIRIGLIDQISLFKLAITSSLIAFKMEEILIPPINIMLESVKSNVTKIEIMEFEIEILKTLEFGTNIYTAGIFLKIFILIGVIDNYKLVFEMACLFTDIALTDVILAGYPYSFLAATVFCVSDHIMNEKKLGSSIWNDSLIYLTGIKWEDINYMCVRLCQILKNVTQKAIDGHENTMIKKYSKHDNISSIFVGKAKKLFEIFPTKCAIIENKQSGFC